VGKGDLVIARNFDEICRVNTAVFRERDFESAARSPARPALDTSEPPSYAHAFIDAGSPNSSTNFAPPENGVHIETPPVVFDLQAHSAQVAFDGDFRRLAREVAWTRLFNASGGFGIPLGPVRPEQLVHMLHLPVKLGSRRFGNTWISVSRQSVRPMFDGQRAQAVGKVVGTSVDYRTRVGRRLRGGCVT